MSLRDKILAANSAKSVEVHVPEWDCTVYIGVMSGTLRDRFETACKTETSISLGTKIVAYTLRDENGQVVFTEADLVALGEQSWIVINRLAHIALKLNSADGYESAEKN